MGLLSFLKSKPALSELIPDNHVDFHSHILFGIDDGAKTASDAVRLVKGMMQMGCSKLIATPHVMDTVWQNTPESIAESLGKTVAALRENGLDVPVRAAAEYLMDSFFATRIHTEKLLCIHDNMVLVEMSYLNPPLQLYEILFELQLAGYVPILAHPERYPFYHGNFGEYRKLKDAGCFFQVNLLSSVGYYGKSIAKTADLLLKQGFIDFAGSDIHHAKHLSAFGNRIIIESEKELKNAIANNALFLDQS